MSILLFKGETSKTCPVSDHWPLLNQVSEDINIPILNRKKTWFEESVTLIKFVCLV